MIGYLIHLYQPWNALRHVFVVAANEQDMLHQFLSGRWCKMPGNVEGSRVVRCFTTPLDWEEFARFSLCELCTECDHGRQAA